MPRQPSSTGSFIEAVVSLIEVYAEAGNHKKKEHELGVRLAILDAVCAEIVWGLGDEYDVDVIISRHADNIAAMVSEMNEHASASDEKE